VTKDAAPWIGDGSIARLDDRPRLHEAGKKCRFVCSENRPRADDDRSRREPLNVLGHRLTSLDQIGIRPDPATSSRQMRGRRGTSSDS